LAHLYSPLCPPLRSVFPHLTICCSVTTVMVYFCISLRCVKPSSPPHSTIFFYSFSSSFFLLHPRPAFRCANCRRRPPPPLPPPPPPPPLLLVIYPSLSSSSSSRSSSRLSSARHQPLPSFPPSLLLHLPPPHSPSLPPSPSFPPSPPPSLIFLYIYFLFKQHFFSFCFFT